jgi:hypothetical protein
VYVSLAWLLLSLELILLLPEAVHSDHNEYRLLRHLMANYDSNARKSSAPIRSHLIPGLYTLLHSSGNRDMNLTLIRLLQVLSPIPPKPFKWFSACHSI